MCNHIVNLCMHAVSLPSSLTLTHDAKLRQQGHNVTFVSDHDLLCRPSGRLSRVAGVSPVTSPSLRADLS